MKAKIRSGKSCVNIQLSLPGDKSIAHRALIIGSLGKGCYTIRNYPRGEDCMSTLRCMRKLGIKCEYNEKDMVVESPGYKCFNRAANMLNAGNSGTTARLMAGLLAGIGAESVIIGDESLSKRPMHRIINPLEQMGAKIESVDGKLPLRLFANNGLSSINYSMPVASAQVKSCILIAGFLSKGITVVNELKPTRDHTERMFSYLGAKISSKESVVSIESSELYVSDIFVPGDISTAAFIVACAVLSKNCSTVIKDVLLNEGRRKYLDIMKSMGADVEYTVEGTYNGEEVGTVSAKSSQLKPVIIEDDVSAHIIDEIPVLSVLAAFADGTTIISGVDELKHKESNRILSVVKNLKSAGIEAAYEKNSIYIYGKNQIIDEDVLIETYKDHRIALAFAAMAIRNKKETIIDDWSCTEVSFPGACSYLKHFLNIELYM